MMSAAPLVLRVNQRRTSRDRVLSHLRAEGIACDPGTYAPFAIVVHQRVNLTQHPLYLDGIIEVQDEGSQLVGLACGVTPSDTILDACAGAGGKALHLADLQSDHGRITAHDVEWQRLKEVSKRAARAGIRSISIAGPGAFDGRSGRNRGGGHTSTYSLVLVDAPCSGLGTVRRMPMVKWRITPELLERHARKQLLVLDQYVPFVEDGGVLVYATCSIMPQENEHVVTRFLAAHPEFTLETIPWSTAAGIPDTLAPQGASGMFQADPLHHGTEGLFVARLRRL
jgi:16S rRNA (cytosine967-C5)-methyltransferase